MRVTVKSKVIALASAAAILPASVTLMLMLEFQGSVGTKAEQQLKVMGKAGVSQVARDVYNLCVTAESLAGKDPARRQAAMEAVRKVILQTAVGTGGYVAVIGAKDSNRARYIVSPGSRRDGEVIWEARDSTGRLFVQDMVNRAGTVPRGEIFTDEYPWRNPGDPKDRQKICAMIYFEPWDWLINSGTFEDEYYVAAATVHDSVRTLMTKLAAGSCGVLLLTLVCSAFLSGRLARPVAITAGVAQKIAAGDVVDARRDLAAFSGGNGPAGMTGFLRTEDETTDLLRAFDTMTSGLDSLIGQVQRSGIQVNSSAKQIAASARELEASAAEQAASTREVTATSREISSTSADLLRTMEQVGSAVSQAGSRAEAGRTDLGRMRTATEQLARSTNSIAAKLGVVSDRASKISSVVTTINKISDQTGMLALNAAIEAEKAGEYGRGFSVVAREISRLADQTAAATEDISAVIREMQSSVSGGVMEMDRFSEEVRRRVQEVDSVGAQIGGIIEHVQQLGPQFDVFKEGMRGQAEGAHQISEAMTQLSLTADQTRQSLGEFKSATGQLNGALEALQNEVSRFRITA